MNGICVVVDTSPAGSPLTVVVTSFYSPRVSWWRKEFRCELGGLQGLVLQAELAGQRQLVKSLEEAGMKPQEMLVTKGPPSLCSSLASCRHIGKCSEVPH